MSGGSGLSGTTLDTICGARTYGSFRRRLLASGCRRCGLHRERRHIVVDRGRPAAGIMAVGEGPGRDEDAAGTAFVGRAGRLLDRLLAEAGLDPVHDLVIANIVKCRPPGNRAPRREEAASCLPYLRAQVRLVRPHTLLLLGASAARFFLGVRGRFTLREEVGRLRSSAEAAGAAVMVLYHPAFLLRDPRAVPVTAGHLATLREHLQREGRWPRP